MDEGITSFGIYLIGVGLFILVIKLPYIGIVIVWKVNMHLGKDWFKLGE